MELKIHSDGQEDYLRVLREKYDELKNSLKLNSKLTLEQKQSELKKINEQFTKEQKDSNHKLF